MPNSAPTEASTPLATDVDNRAQIDPALPLRKWLYAWLIDPEIVGNYQKSVDRWISFLIIANLCAIFFEQVEAIYKPYQQWFDWFEILSVAVFTVEYLLRFYLAPEDADFKKSQRPRSRYLVSPFAIIDFLAIAPFYLQAVLLIDLRYLRFLRLLRILKLFRILVPAYREFAAANAGRTFRQKMHALVFPSRYGGELHEYFDTFIAFWVIISVIAVVLESVHSVHYVLNVQFFIFDALAVTIFTIEYSMRIYCCVEDPRYRQPVSGRLALAKTPSVVIDFLAILPFFLEVFLHHLFDLRFLRIFRLLRLLKLTRYNTATATLGRVVMREWPVLGAAAFVMMLLVVLTASLGYLFEHEAQPDKFENIPQAIYWAVVTLASVGYGDISPITPLGRTMTILLALIGIGIFAIPAALLASAFADELSKERAELKAQLYAMLEDGVISPDERAVLNREAKRVHLSPAEIDRMVQQVREQRTQETDLSKMPLHKIAARPAHAVEHYKSLMSQIRELGLLTDAAQFEHAAASADRLTVSELILWRQINGAGKLPEG